MMMGHNAYNIRHLLQTTFEGKFPLTVRPGKNIFSEVDDIELVSNSNVRLCQGGYHVIAEANEDMLCALPYMLEDIKESGLSNQNSFQASYNLGAIGVCRFLEVFGETYENLGLNLSISLSGIAPLSNEKFRFDAVSEQTSAYYPDLTVSKNGEKKCFIEVKYSAGTYTDFKLKKISRTRDIYKLNKSDHNGYVHAGQKDGLPVYLAVVMNKYGNKDESIVTGMKLEDKIAADYVPISIRKENLMTPGEFLSDLYDLLDAD